jgi:hypothetical protein
LQPYDLDGGINSGVSFGNGARVIKYLGSLASAVAALLLGGRQRPLA